MDGYMVNLLLLLLLQIPDKTDFRGGSRYAPLQIFAPPLRHGTDFRARSARKKFRAFYHNFRSGNHPRPASCLLRRAERSTARQHDPISTRHARNQHAARTETLYRQKNARPLHDRYIALHDRYIAVTSSAVRARSAREKFWGRVTLGHRFSPPRYTPGADFRVTLRKSVLSGICNGARRITVGRAGHRLCRDATGRPWSH